MRNLRFLGKFSTPILMAIAVLSTFVLPAGAWAGKNQAHVSWPENGDSDQQRGQLLSIRASLPITELKLSAGSGSAAGSGSPDIEVSPNSTYIAVAYFKIAQSQGDVYIKSATDNNSDGWLTSRFLGKGSKPRLAFSQKGGEDNVVYVVWVAVDNRSINYARCELSSDKQPNCTAGTVFSTDNLVDDPAAVVDNNGLIHVAWESGGNILSARSTDEGQSWPQLLTISAGANTDFKTPQLAFSNGVVHLAYVHKNTANLNLPGEAIEYRRRAVNEDSWSGAHIFNIGGEVTAGYDDIDNPTLTANGSNVYLAWEGHSASFGGINNNFGLMRVASTNSGLTWNDSNSPRHITSNNLANSSPEANKLSKSQQAGATVPIQEEGLRPSMTISGSNFAIVWQQRPDSGCGEGENSSSEIFFAHNPSGWIMATLDNNEAKYSIDPDLAVDTNGDTHFAYMKDDAAFVCDGGEAAEYAIYYRGPFTKQVNDEGEEPPTNPPGQPTVYLPIIRK